MQNVYMRELQSLKTHDEVQSYRQIEHEKNYGFITTAGHGYLVVPCDDENYLKAWRIAKYGYKGIHAIYLEEDCEAGEFLSALT
jgi:tRNA uridine 5-carbamoylmethylation protein Kti12